MKLKNMCSESSSRMLFNHREDLYFHYLGQTEFNHFCKPKNLFCLTLYNEPLDSFALSLCSLIDSLLEYEFLANSVLTIFIDGKSSADPEIIMALVKTNRIKTANISSETIDAYFSMGPVDDLLVALKYPKLSPVMENIRMIIFSKPINMGKLHSHGLFYGSLCPCLEPSYCHQMDVGTLLSKDCVYRLTRMMDDSADIGAVAPRIATLHPSDYSLLAVWQYWDFTLSYTFIRPTEIMTGHLSVLPGQYSAVRWMAMRTVTQGPLKSGEPVTAYLGGLEAEDPIDRISFLAEDRVIGNEIMFNCSGLWRLSYDPDALALTDACTTLNELLRQRRRWINGATAARVCLFNKSFKWAMKKNLSWRERLRILVSCLWQANLLFLEQWGSILLLITLMLTSVDLFSEFNSSASTDVAVRLNITYLLYFICAIIIIAALFILMNISSCFASNNSRKFRTILIYLVINPFFRLIVILYANFNIHDDSWGTKGLTNPNNRTQFMRMKRFRNKMFAIWLSVTAILIFTSLLNDLGMVNKLGAFSAPFLETLTLECFLIIFITYVFRNMTRKPR